MYINQMNEKDQNRVVRAIEKALHNEGLTGEEFTDALDNAVNSKLEDLSALINVKNFK